MVMATEGEVAMVGDGSLIHMSEPPENFFSIFKVKWVI